MDLKWFEVIIGKYVIVCRPCVFFLIYRKAFFFCAKRRVVFVFVLLIWILYFKYPRTLLVKFI
jgi:hypothetical protein